VNCTSICDMPADKCYTEMPASTVLTRSLSFASIICAASACSGQHSKPLAGLAAAHLMCLTVVALHAAGVEWRCSARFSLQAHDATGCHIIQ
jgi:hypothetical protein